MRQYNKPISSSFHRCTFVVCAICIFIMVEGNSFAAASGPSADIMVVLDLSGSMKTSDNGKRFDAFFSWVTAFTASGDKIGIVSMGNGSKLVAPLTAKENFSFSNYNNKLDRRAKYTDVAAGLENAYYELKNNSRSQSAKLILLFSDAQIDMPKGMWDLENSLRYLRNSLIPSMKQEDIRLIAIVPDGLKANFQLLQELTHATNGVYYRGLPGDAVATRRQKIDRAASNADTKKGFTSGATQKKSVAEKTMSETGPPTKSFPVARDKENRNVKKADENQLSQSTSQELRTEFLMLGVIIFLGFAIVLSAIVILFKRTGVKKAESADELVDMLQELQSIKSEAEKSDIAAEQFEDALDDDGEPDFGEPKERLSVSLVSPFLDYEESNGAIQKHPTDEITARPAFSTNHAEDTSFSISNMETLIGTGLPEVEDKE